MWESLRVKNSTGWQVRRKSSHFFEFYLSEVYQDFTVNMGGKFSHASGRGRGKRKLLNMLEHSVLLNKACLEKNYFTRTQNLLGSY